MANKFFGKFGAVIRWTGARALYVGLSVLGLGLSVHAQEATFIEFDVPGSTCKASFPRCTTPVAINAAGALTGYYADTNAALHGFLRASDGSFTRFDGPGTACAFFFSTCTQPAAINPQGAITGFYCDAITCHGFLRAPNGTITTFDPTGSVFTQANAINPGGAITGIWYDLNFAGHGFLRAIDGAFTTFDAKGAVNGTSPVGINPDGAVVGTYYDATFAGHGFLRAPDGTITTFDPTGSVYTQPNAINPVGAIVGYYQDASFAIQGFLRSSDGAFTKFDVTGSIQTYAVGINPQGAIAGYYTGGGGFHGFLRARNGTLTTFDPPGSEEPYSETLAVGINEAGVITGWYIDPSFLGHGFLRIPNGAVPVGINPEGAIAVPQQEAVGFHGFARARGGAFAAFGTTGLQGTLLPELGPWRHANPAGVIGGWRLDPRSLGHALLRIP